jgi:nicotinamide-nucleotide amidase
MMPMFEAQVLPRLRPAPGRTVRTRVLHTVGLGESDLASRLGDLMDRSRTPLVGTTASGGIVSIRIRYEGPLLPADAEALIAQTEAACRERAAPFVFGCESQTLAERVIAGLKDRGQSLAVVESCTGGALGASLTDVAGSSSAFVGGWITYTNAMKSREVGVSESLFAPGGTGAVSRECAGAMAIGGLERANADWALAVTGIAGPAGATPHKPVGTVYVALAGKQLPSPDIRLFRMGGDRASIRDWSVKAALALLWMHLNGTPSTPLLRQALARQS